MGRKHTHTHKERCDIITVVVVIHFGYGRGKDVIRFGFRIEAGAEITTIIVDIFGIIKQVRDTGIHLKVRSINMNINININRPRTEDQ